MDPEGYAIGLSLGESPTSEPSWKETFEDGTTIQRDDGLTDEEGEVMDALKAAVNAYGRLSRQHPDELRDFVDAIHRCQDLLALRVAHRHWPKGWLTQGVNENG